MKSAATMFGMVTIRHISTFGAGVAGMRGAGVAIRHSVVPAAQRLPLLNARASAGVYAYAEQELSTLCLHGVGAVQLQPTGWVGVSVPTTSTGVGVEPVGEGVVTIGVINAGAGVRCCSVGIGVEPAAAAGVPGVAGAGVVAAVGDRVGESVGIRVGEKVAVAAGAGVVAAVGAGVAMGEAAEEGAAGVGTAV